MVLVIYLKYYFNVLNGYQRQFTAKNIDVKTEENIFY